MTKADVLWGALFGLFSGMVILFSGVALGVATADLDPDCMEDEAYAWQQNGGYFPDSVTWACVPLDNLITLDGAR